MLKEFRDFLLRGNIVELAVAFVMGVAFAAARQLARGQPRDADHRDDHRQARLQQPHVHDQRRRVPLRRVHHRRDPVRRDRGGGVLLRGQADERDHVARPEAGRGGDLRRRAPPPGAARRAPGARIGWTARGASDCPPRRTSADRFCEALAACRGPGRQRPHGLQGPEHARDECLARARVVADRERLAGAAEDHLLVRDEAGEPDRVDRDLAAHPLRRSPSRCPTAHRASCRRGARRSPPAGASGPPPPRNASSAPPRPRSSARRSTERPPRAPRDRARPRRTRSCPRRTGTPAARQAAAFARTASGRVKSTARHNRQALRHDRRRPRARRARGRERARAPTFPPVP